MTDDHAPIPFDTGTAGALAALGGQRAREGVMIAARARAECAQRRARVLRYPDLVAAMAAQPLRLDAARWNGYVPPRTGQEQLPEPLFAAAGAGRGRPNGKAAMVGPTELNISPQRAALVAICAEAYRRDVEAGLAPPPSGASDPDPAGSPDDGPAQLDPPAIEPPAIGQAALGWPEGSAGEAANP